MAGLEDGARQFDDLAKNLLLVGEVELRKELFEAVSDAAQPIVDAIRTDVPDYLPKRGGYAEAVQADLAMSVVRRSTREGPGATIRVTARPYQNSSNRSLRRTHTGRKLKRLNAGLLAHPLYGDREHWYSQTVRPGFVTEVAQQQLPEVREKIAEAVRRVTEMATRGI